MAGWFGSRPVPNQDRQQQWDEPSTGLALNGRSPWRVVVRRLATIAGVVLLAAVGVFGGGVATGWELSARRDISQPEPSARTVAVPDYAAGGDAIMPDVRGMELAGARTALADAGIPEVAVVLTDEPWAGTGGVVIEQTPQFGARKPAKVTLGVSTRARIPAVVGRAQAQSLSFLEGLGARVVLKRRFEPGIAAGTVLAVQPPAGSLVPEEVILSVAEAAGAVYLDQLTAVEGSCSSGAAAMNGTEHQHAVQCSANSDSPIDVSYLLNRVASSVSGLVGVPDDGPPSARVMVEILADDRSVARVTAGYGKPVALKATVRGALRLAFRISAIPAKGLAGGGGGVTAVLAEVQVAGDPSGIDALTKKS